MTDGFFIRSAGEGDLAAIRELLVETWHATYDRIYGAARVTAITDDWHSIPLLRSRLAIPRSEFIVADDGHRLGGMAFARSREDGVVDIRQLYVRPGFQGRGVGARLLAEIEASFPEERSFRLEVQERNGPAVRFYRRHGFRECHRVIDEANLTTLTMRKDLGSAGALA